MTSTSGPTRFDLATVGKIHVALLALVAGAAHATAWAEAGSVLLGGAVMGLNLWLMKLIAAALVPSSPDAAAGGTAGLAIVALLLKFGLFLGLLAILFWRLPVDVMGFATGVTVLLVACVVAALWRGAGAQGEG